MPGTSTLARKVDYSGSLARSTDYSGALARLVSYTGSLARVCDITPGSSLYITTDNFNTYAAAKFAELSPGGTFAAFVSTIVFGAAPNLEYPSINQWNLDLAAGNVVLKSDFDTAAAAYSP